MPTDVPYRPAHHLISAADFDALAAGRGDGKTVDFLRSAEYSRRLLLLRALLDALAASPGALGPLPPVDTAWNTLTAAEQRAPGPLRELLLHPQTGTWLAHCLRRLSGNAGGDGPLWADAGHLYAVCAVAALRAGVPLRTTVPLRDGAVMFPTLGLARLPGAAARATAEVSVEGGRLRVGGGGESVEPPDSGDAPGWQGLRRLRAAVAGRPVEIWLDDVDPYRDLGEPLAPARLAEPEVAVWQDRFAVAMALLEHDDETTAEAMAAGLRTVAVVPAGSYGQVLSASSGDAFGGLMTSLPPDPLSLAVTLVHEFQHTKLGGLLHLLTLHQDSGAERHYSPWRNDPRPLGGLLQGAYAFLGVTDFWCRRLDSAGADERPVAEYEFALHRRQTRYAVRALDADPGLTDLGRRFLRGMAARLPSWWAGRRVAPDLAALAELSALDHRTGWRVRHLAPAPDDVQALARAFAAGAPAPADHCLAEPALVPDLGAPWSLARTGLVRQRLAAATGRVPAGSWPEPSDADRALVRGEPARALDAYAALLAADPEDPDAWTGLLLALTATTPGARRLLRRPELPRAVHRELRASGAESAPERVSGWLAGVRTM